MAEPRESQLAGENGKESREKLEYFYFKDKHGEYKLTQELKLLCDSLENRKPLSLYLYNLIHTSIDQKKQRKESKKVPEYFIDSMNPTFIERRNMVLDSYGRDIVLRLESCLEVDSLGIEAGDSRPFLGVNKDLVLALSHYCDPTEGYEVIE